MNCAKMDGWRRQGLDKLMACGLFDGELSGDRVLKPMPPKTGRGQLMGAYQEAFVRLEGEGRHFHVTAGVARGWP